MQVFALTGVLVRASSFALMVGITLLGPTITVEGQAISPGTCPDPVAIMKAFYDANDASQFEKSLGFFTDTRFI